jgi:hypothetical protein
MNVGVMEDYKLRDLRASHKKMASRIFFSPSLSTAGTPGGIA